VTASHDQAQSSSIAALCERTTHATGGAIGWQLRDEWRHTHERSFFTPAKGLGDITADKPRRDELEKSEPERATRRDASKGPVDACLRKVVDKVVFGKVRGEKRLVARGPNKRKHALARACIETESDARAN
jgi:hypothetical protein